MSTGISSQTVAGLMEFCEWLKAKGYQGPAAAESWKSATKMVFETVEPDTWEAISLDGIDVDDYVRRFQTLGGSKYRAETVTVYGRRIKNAIEAQAYYIEHGKPPSFKRGASRSENGGQAAGQKSSPSRSKRQDPPPGGHEPQGDLVEFPFPLRNGQMAKLHLPARGLDPKDADRMSAFLRSLQMEEQRQLPEHTGEEELAA